LGLNVRFQAIPSQLSHNLVTNFSPTIDRLYHNQGNQKTKEKLHPSPTLKSSISHFRRILNNIRNVSFQDFKVNFNNELFSLSFLLFFSNSKLVFFSLSSRIFFEAPERNVAEDETGLPV
jgi:hypothetical protein